METQLIPPVLIDDDGELDEVRRLLDELEIEFVTAAGSDAERASLLVSNARKALARASGVASDRALVGAFHLVVADKISKRAQRELERVRLDFLVQRPVDPAALRLVVLHALYSGPERRRAPRVAMSAVVRCRAGVVSRPATLVELSQSGCRLTSGQKLETGQSLAVIVPRDLTGSRRLSIEGRVVAVAPAGELDPRRQAYSVQFQRVDAGTRKALRAVMVMHGLGSAILQPRTRPGSLQGDLEPPTRAAASEDAPAGEMGASPKERSERRAGPRGKFKRPVLAAARGCSNILIGRDLSLGGMRVDPHPELNVGDELKLVIHGHLRKHPLVVKASVARDEGDDGCVLQFHAMSPHASAQLEGIVDSLPRLRSPGPGGDAGPNVVVSELVEEP